MNHGIIHHWHHHHDCHRLNPALIRAAIRWAHTGPLIMPGKVGVRSTHSYTIYGRRVGYRLRSVHPFEGLFGTNVGFRSPPPRPPSASPRCRSGTGPPTDLWATSRQWRGYGLPERDMGMGTGYVPPSKNCVIYWDEFEGKDSGVQWHSKATRREFWNQDSARHDTFPFSTTIHVHRRSLALLCCFSHRQLCHMFSYMRS